MIFVLIVNTAVYLLASLVHCGRMKELSLEELGSHAQETTLLLALALEVHLESDLGGLLDDILLAGTGLNLALGGFVVE